jgi:hypothetical protein
MVKNLNQIPLKKHSELEEIKINVVLPRANEEKKMTYKKVVTQKKRWK